MEAFVSRKRRKLSPPREIHPPTTDDTSAHDLESTDFKLAILASLHPDKPQDVLLDYLSAYDGSVERVCEALAPTTFRDDSPRKRSAGANGYQSSLVTFTSSNNAPTATTAPAAPKSLTKKGKTIHLYSPADVEAHTPCSIIHNFLSPSDADALLQELLDEVPTFHRDEFQLFDKTVESPHTSRFYVDSLKEAQEQQTDYVYNGNYMTDIAQTTPVMLRLSSLVRAAVNAEITRRITTISPSGEKLKFQSPEEWIPNASFVNCYDGAKESVGYHSDQLTYLGPRAVIGSLSLGVAREFRVRRIVPPAADSSSSSATADAQGQIAIHLPHNSLLIMHAEMQEEWKHAVAPAAAIDPHPRAGNKRINVTYRCYKEYMHPRHTPKCRCGTPAILRCVQKRAATRGRYMWMCHTNYVPGQKGCSYFVWAEFDVDGKPPWVEGYKGNANGVVLLDR